MSTPLDLPQLRQVGLTAFEIKTIGELVKQGGEVAWYPERVKPITNEMIDAMMQKGIVYLESPSGGIVPIGMIPAAIGKVIALHGSRLRLRLTDQGRGIAAQLETMMAAPKLEVASG